MLTLANVIRAAIPGGPVPAGLADTPIRRVCIDSRQATDGSLFVAFAGEHVDGHAYVADAFARGAVAALVACDVAVEGAWSLIADADAGAAARLPLLIPVADTLTALQAVARAHRQAFVDLCVVGVTGSVGKTTTKEAVAAVLAAAAPTLKSEGNLNNEIGLPLTLTALDGSYRYAVLEMGMYALGEIALLCDVALPRIGVVTNVEPVHLERLGSVERIAEAKSELVRALPGDGLAVLNGDDPRVRTMANVAPCAAITFGFGQENDYRALDVTPQGLDGVRFTVRGPDGEAALHTPALGKHQVMNALAAAAVGRTEGLAWETITQGLADAGHGLRLVPRQGARGIRILDDSYNASPTTTIGALAVLAEVDGRRVAVLGDMLELGAVEREGHLRVGRRAAETVDALVTVGERAGWIAEEARQAGLAQVWQAATNAEALDLLRRVLGGGETVLVKGSRGMAMEEIVAALEAGL